jgi:hypothetical protein
VNRLEHGTHFTVLIAHVHIQIARGARVNAVEHGTHGTVLITAAFQNDRSFVCACAYVPVFFFVFVVAPAPLFAFVSVLIF